MVAGGDAQLFDLSNDPGEQHDLASEREADVAELRAALEAWRRDVSTPRSFSRSPE